MSENNVKTNVWSQLDQLSTNEIMYLVEASVHVLKTGLKDSENFNENASMALLNTLNDTLLNSEVEISNDHFKSIISEDEESLNLSKELLIELAKIPELAEEIEDVYNNRKKMMSFEPVSWLLAAALFVLAVKVKEIDLKKGKIQFFNLSDKAIEALLKFLKINKGV